eukprot:3040947-Pleurochrysis_carterae.AAC.1
MVRAPQHAGTKLHSLLSPIVGAPQPARAERARPHIAPWVLQDWFSYKAVATNCVAMNCP